MTRSDDPSLDLEFLEETLNLAGQELLQRQGKNLEIGYKPDASLVTDADLASERVILERISKYYPKDMIYSEEAGISSEKRLPGTKIWIIDPLDGTTNFANGYPFYCVSIARGVIGEKGRIEVELGGILDPCREKTYLAARGRGARVNGKPMQVAKPRELAKSFLVTGFYYMKGADLDAEIRRFARVAQSCQSIRRDGAAALDLAMTAEGIYDAFWEIGLQPWDLAAGTLMVTEAGGVVRNYPPAPSSNYDVEGIGVVAGASEQVGAVAALL